MARLLQSLLCNGFSLREQNHRRRSQAIDRNRAATSDRVLGAKTQSIQIAYTGRYEAIQNSRLHKQIVLTSDICIAYLNCLIQITNHSDCLVLCVKGSDRTGKIAESRFVQGFQRLPQVARSGKKAPKERSHKQYNDKQFK